MARQNIELGTPPSGVGGDTPRSANTKVNAMFAELYPLVGLVGLGGVVDSGSNSSGSYVKYADGTMECWGNISGLDQTVANQPYSKGVGFPVGFVDINYSVMVNIDSLNVSNIFSGYARAGRGNANSFVLIQCWNYVQTYVYTYIARGRWK